MIPVTEDRQSTRATVERLVGIARDAPEEWSYEDDEAYQAFQRTFKQPVVFALVHIASLSRRWAEDFGHGDLEEGSGGREVLDGMLAALRELEGKTAKARRRA